jgi:hypothetical protein
MGMYAKDCGHMNVIYYIYAQMASVYKVATTLVYGCRSVKVVIAERMSLSENSASTDGVGLPICM